MRLVDSSSFWSSFPHDPRDPGNASLRAADRDREALHQVLAEAYADGRLDREEHDERSAAVTAARTLGELPDLVADLVPTAPTPARRPPTDLATATSEDLARRAHDAWRHDVREAVATLLVPSLICVVVWLATSAPDGHFWPMWVMLGTGVNLLQTVLRRREIVENHRRKLEKKQAREWRRRELGP